MNAGFFVTVQLAGQRLCAAVVMVGSMVWLEKR